MITAPARTEHGMIAVRTRRSVRLLGWCLAFAVLVVAAPAAAQEAAPDSIREAIERGRRTGPLVDSFGGVYEVEDEDLAFSPDGQSFKVLFESFTRASSPDRVNPGIGSVARFLNMNGQAGVSAGQLDVALIIHGNAVFEALSNEGYRSRFEMDNPNLPLLEELKGAGVRIYVCSQSAASRGLGTRELAEPVTLAFSAMNVLIAHQEDGYAMISRDWAVPPAR